MLFVTSQGSLARARRPCRPAVGDAPNFRFSSNAFATAVTLAVEDV